MEWLRPIVILPKYHFTMYLKLILLGPTRNSWNQKYHSILTRVELWEVYTDSFLCTSVYHHAVGHFLQHKRQNISCVTRGGWAVFSQQEACRIESGFFSVEFACSLRAGVGFCRQTKNMNARLTVNAKFPAGVSERVNGCLYLSN